MTKVNIHRYEVETANPVFAKFKDNPYKTETAGFIPLDVKFKRFEQAGIAMQFHQNEFTSADYREMYLNPDFEITPEDDFEEVQEKMYLQQKFMYEKANASNDVKAKAGTQEPEQKLQNESSKVTNTDPEQE